MKRDLAQRFLFFLFFDLYKRISENRSLEKCLMTKNHARDIYIRYIILQEYICGSIIYK